MLKKVLPQIGVAAIFFALTLIQQYLFYAVNGLPIVWLTFGKYIGMFAFFLAGTLVRPRWGSFAVLAFIFTVNFFQMVHLSYFGTQVLPGEIWLLFTQMHEIQGTLFVELHHILVPLALTVVPLVIGHFALKKLDRPFQVKWLGILFALYFVYNPARTYITGNKWGRQPSTRELSGMNIYLSFSYFAGKILPYKLAASSHGAVKNSSTELAFSEEKTASWDKVIFILGESLSPHHMSLFGYDKVTTPYLDSIKNDPDFFFVNGLSGGVSSDISVAFLMNLGFGEAGSLKAAKGNHCLFKLARDKGFTTHFYSAQSAEQLRYIAPYLCASSLNEYKALEEIAPETADHQAADDKVLLPHLEKLLATNDRQFIMLHQRGSHGPWELRSNEKNRKFPHDNKVGHYDNSVLEFDLFYKELSEKIQKSGKKTLVIYVSDHGEALGQEGRWGHGQLTAAAFEVPVLVRSFGQTLPVKTKSLPKHLPHFNLIIYLARELGWKANQEPDALPKDYVIYGNDIDGFAGKTSVRFNDDGSYAHKVEH